MRGLAWMVGLVVGCGPSVGPSAVGGTGGGETSTSTSADDGAANGVDDDPDSETSARPEPATTGGTSSDGTPETGDPSTGSSDGGSDTTGAVATDGPSRVFIFYTPHGYFPEQAWSGEGEDFTLGPTLEALAPWQDDLLIVEGVRNFAVDPEGVPPTNPHAFASAALLTGGLLGNGTGSDDDPVNFHWAGGPSLDVALGDALSQAQPFSSLHLGVRDGVDHLVLGVSYAGADQPNPAYVGPVETFDTIFGPLAAGNPALQMLQAQAAAADPDDAVSTTDAQAAIASMALAMDMSRSVLLSIDVGIPTLVWQGLGVDAEFVELMAGGNDAQALAVLTFFGTTLATIVDTLDSVPGEKGGTLLDETLVLWVSEYGNGQSHDLFRALTIVVDASHTLVTGQVANVEALDVDQADWAATVAAALSVDLGEFGAPEYDATPVDALLNR